MPVTVRFDPTSVSKQAQIIPDASEFNDGVMTADMVKRLDNITPINLEGDVTGPPITNTVVKIQNRAVSAAAPSLNDVLTWDGAQWVPAPGGGGGGGAPVFTPTPVQTADYVASFWQTVRCDPSGGPFAVTLPTAVGNAGKQVKVKNVTDSIEIITVNTTGGQTIDRKASVPMSTEDACLTFESDNTNWMVV